MTISEANAVNLVLNALLGIPDPDTEPREVAQACELLADKANKALMAGITPETVRRRWPKALRGGALARRS